MFVALTRAREARRFPGALRRSDLLEPSGRRCGCWSTSQFLFSGIVGRQILVRALTSASPGRGGGDGAGADRAQRGRGSSTTDRKIRSTYRGGACSCSRSAPAAAALNDHRNLAALLMFVALTRAREARRFPGALRRSDLLEPSGRRCGCWSTSQFLFSGIVGRQILVRGLTSASPGSGRRRWCRRRSSAAR